MQKIRTRKQNLLGGLIGKPRCPRALQESLERRTLLSVTPAGEEFLVNTFTTNSQLNSSVAMDAAGNFVVVWQSFGQDGSAEGIFGQLYAADGTAVGVEFQVNDYTTSAQSAPSVAMDADGDFVVAWQSNGQEGIGAEIWARRFTAAGPAAGDEFHVNQVTTGGQVAPSVAMDDAGNFVIAWHGQNPDTASYDVYIRRYSAAGAALSGETVINTYTTGSQTAASVAMDADGDFVVVWQSFGQDGNGTGVFGRKFDSAGAPVTAELPVNQFTTNSQAAPAVAMADNGAFVVTWESNLQVGAGHEVYARRYDTAGAPVNDEFLVNTTTADQQRVPAVAMDADGDFIITWASRLQDGNAYGIYAQSFSAAGTPVGGEFLVNTYTTASQFNPAVALNSTGNVVITWQSDGQDGSGFGVYGQRFEPSDVEAPVVSGDEFVWQNAPQRLEYTFNTDVSASLDNADILLENLTTMTTIAAANIAVNYDGSTNTATFTFSFPPTATWLPDGQYRATLLAAGITNSAGTPLAGNYVVEFFFLQGDANHDGIVNLTDFNRVAGNFGASPRDFTQGDFNYDGLVNLADFNILAGRFGQSVLAPLTQSSVFGGTRIGTSASKDDGGSSRLAELD